MKKVIALVLLALMVVLTAAALPTGGYAVVDDDAPFTGSFVYTSIQAALDSGARWVDVRGGDYAENLNITTDGVTIQFQGVTLPNDGNSVSITVNADDVTIKGDYCIEGGNDGSVPTGDFFHGTGVYIAGARTTLDGLCTRNLFAFSVIAPDTASLNDLCATRPAALSKAGAMQLDDVCRQAAGLDAGTTPDHTTIRNCTITNVATAPTPQLYAPIGILFIGNTTHNSVHDCTISGTSGAIHAWYGSSFNDFYNNVFMNVWGWILGSDGRFAARSGFEIYGVPGAPCVGNHMHHNRIDGSHNPFEVADVDPDTTISYNTVRHTTVPFWVGGSGTNKATNVVISYNRFYGEGNAGSGWFSGSGFIGYNLFDGFTSAEVNNTGTIYFPADALGDVDVTGNQFLNGGMIARYSAPAVLPDGTPGGTLEFRNNTIRDAEWGTQGGIYFADTTNPNAVIDGNVFTGTSGTVIAQNAGTRITVTNNQIQGRVALGAGSVVENNTFYTVYGDWTSVLVENGMIVRNNTIHADNVPIHVWGSTEYALVKDNRVSTLGGAAAPLPACPLLSTCTGNWTAGQTPPP